MTQKSRIIFTVTTGRSGTNYLAFVLSLLKNTMSTHEPSPNFVDQMRQVQKDSNCAKKFLLEKKIPSICSNKVYPIYAETSHVFCKGYLEPWLEIQEMVVPDLVLLDRNISDISKSLVKLGTIPGRTKTGLQWYLSPTDPTCLTTLNNWETMSDYQLCYWYCLEIEARKDKYKKLVEERGGKAVRINLNDLSKFRKFREFRKEMALPGFTFLGFLRYIKNYRKKINNKDNKKVNVEYDSSEFLLLEEEVRQNIIYKDYSLAKQC